MIKRRIKLICRNCKEEFEVPSCYKNRYKNCPKCRYSRPHNIIKICKECGKVYILKNYEKL